MAKQKRRSPQRYTEKILQEERKYGFFWYEWLWQAIRPFAVLVISMLVVAGVLLTGWNIVYEKYLMPVNPDNKESVAFVVERGDTLSKVARRLEEDKLIRNSGVLKYMMDFQGMSYKLQPGQFAISPSMTVNEVIESLVAGDGQSRERTITIIPGWTVDDVASYLHKTGALAGDEDVRKFKEFANNAEHFKEKNFAAQHAAESPSKNSRKYQLEGYLAPDTYRVYNTATPEELVNTLLSQMEIVLDRAYNEQPVSAAEADEGEEVIGEEEPIGEDEVEDLEDESEDDGEEEAPRYDNPIRADEDQILILASLIEKEAKSKDFAKVSAVFHNRLNAKMKLESCPTVQYVLGIKRLALTNEDISVDSPYNTYLNAGLPAGPVCNPSLAAIQAALYPDVDFMEEGYLFFCSKDPKSGELQFSKTVEEHNEATKLYRPLWIEYDKTVEESENAPNTVG